MGNCPGFDAVCHIPAHENCFYCAGRTVRMVVSTTTTVLPHIQCVVMVLVELTDVVVMLDRSVTPRILMEMGTNMSVLMMLVVITMTRIVLGSMLCVIFLLMETASIVLGRTVRMVVSTTTTVLAHIQCVVMVLVELTVVVVMLTLTVRLDRSVTPQILMEMGTNMSVLMMLVVTTMTRIVLGSMLPVKLTSLHLHTVNASIAWE